MNNVTVHCLAIESPESGCVNWYASPEAADSAFQEAVNDPDFESDTITRFDLCVNDLLSPDQVTQYVDEAMCWQQFVANNQRQPLTNP